MNRDLVRLLQTSELASREWRLQNLYTIRDADGVLVPFVPNIAQRTFYNRMWYCNHVLKARKLGFSTFIEILYTDDLLFSSTGLSAGIIDFTIEDAMDKLDMMRTAWTHLDNGDIHPTTWKLGKLVKRLVPMTRDAGKSLAFGNGSKAKCSTSLRGTTPQRIHVSELGKTAIFMPRKAREIINGAFNAMTPGNVRNIESTHEGARSGEHYRLLNICMKLDDANLSPIQSRFHFFAWWKDPRYQVRARGHLRKEIVEYFQRLHRDHGITCSPEQMQWYDDKQAEQGHGMKKEFPSTPGEAFEAIAEGAIYGTEMANLRAKGRITDFGLERHLPFYTFWDIGLSDYTAVWLIQPVMPSGFLVLDWMECEGIPGSGMPDRMRLLERKWGKPIARHFLPHDANTRDRGTGKSYAQTLKEAKIGEIAIVPRTPDVWLGIGHVRDVLPHCWFNKAFCDTTRNRDGSLHEADDNDQEEFPSGVACLEGYQKNPNPEGATLREMPKHDLFSHSADAFRTFAEAWRLGMVSPPTDKAPRAVGGVRKPQARR